MKFSARGFTLIELLVVISVIGVLSSIIFAGLTQAREKGRIAAAQKFAGHSYRSAFDSALAEWTFNASSNNYLEDFGRIAVTSTGTFTNGENAPMGTGNSLCMAGSQYFQANLASDLQFPNQGTIMAWVKSGNQGAFPAYHFLFGRYNAFGLAFNSSELLMVYRGGSPASNLEATNMTFGVDRWYHVALSFNGTAAQVYVDGQLKFSTTLTNPSDISNRFIIGAMPTTSGGTPTYTYVGCIDNINVYSRSLVASEIFNVYASQKSPYLLANAAAAGAAVDAIESK